jgi:D-beta-D-heptose 7-phosphate kinase/D-beta-D-heptose 1-phosphate adenosyltransferase
VTERLVRLIESLGVPKILVVGELMLDRYVWGEVSRVSPEAPIPVLRVTNREDGSAELVASSTTSSLLAPASHAARSWGTMRTAP